MLRKGYNKLQRKTSISTLFPAAGVNAVPTEFCFFVQTTLKSATALLAVFARSVLASERRAEKGIIYTPLESHQIPRQGV